MTQEDILYKVELRKQINKCCLAKNKMNMKDSDRQELVELWFLYLGKFALKDVCASIDNYITTSKWFPDVADIIAILQRNNCRMRGEDNIDTSQLRPGYLQRKRAFTYYLVTENNNKPYILEGLANKQIPVTTLLDAWNTFVKKLTPAELKDLNMARRSVGNPELYVFEFREDGYFIPALNRYYMQRQPDTKDITGVIKKVQELFVDEKRLQTIEF